MRDNKKCLKCLLAFALIILLTGCAFIENPVEAILDPHPGYDSPYMARRFQGSGTSQSHAVEPVMELAGKNAALLDENATLKQKVHELVVENQLLKNNIALLEPQLQQTKKELTQASRLLVEMQLELHNWKNNVLGFRNEIRDADKVQLETLRRILEVLGGEFDQPAPAGQTSDETKVSFNYKNELQ